MIPKIVVAIPYDAVLFNETFKNYRGTGGYFVANNIFSRLVVTDVFNPGMIHGDLAHSWDVLDDGERYIFHLRRNAKWHDGHPVTAADVAYTFDEVITNKHHGSAWLRGVKSVRPIDTLTVECTLDGPNSGFLSQMGFFVFTHIVPKHLYESGPWEGNPFNEAPVGSGPFRFEEWSRGEEIILSANDDYWDKAPSARQLRYRVIPSVEEALSLIREGTVHFCTQDVPCGELGQWSQTGRMDVFKHDGHSFSFLCFNWARPMWRDKHAREAVARAIDRRQLVSSACPTAREQRHYYLENVPWALASEVVSPEYDVAYARHLLGLVNAQGARGQHSRVVLVLRGSYAYYRRVSDMLRNQLDRIGLSTEVLLLDPVEWSQRIDRDRDFDLVVQSGGIGPDPEHMASFLESDSPRNVTSYASNEVDGCLRLGRASVAQEARANHYRQLQRLLRDDVAFIPLFKHSEHLAYSTDLTGWPWMEDGRGVPFWSQAKVRRRVESS
jgi:peptide/nickel transport system substrate-binding protein